MNNKDFNEIVLNRRSIKRYDPSVKISREEMEEILAEATRAPSSVNMQPWRFIVIETPEGKKKLAELAKFNSEQVNTSSAVIAVFGDMNNFEYAEEIFGKAVELGYMPHEIKEQQLQVITPVYENMREADMRDVVLIDSGLVSMQLMLVARAHGYDTNPIGGYEKELIAEAFGLDKERYVPIMLISIGKAASEGHASYRLPVNTVTTWK
ncbi:nitroreductase family protein [Priestia megaterium]|uniref:nitroreductase family protein n=1 Tax=Priestia megaterium TaxID=1404 RepID=UPI00207ADEBD|nr:nitroreductase family protein [Priestia megaterium]USL27510.1 nitroreductase family protein [Priestia megaterium]USL33451.1 nitroreductase family protein [Priestia megaterium]USL39384.1 nitroreductase family protein [Priestia megaterium]WDM31543.1 nitroreductase family protein [Priestia megaterium]